MRLPSKKTTTLYTSELVSEVQVFETVYCSYEATADLEAFTEYIAKDSAFYAAAFVQFPCFIVICFFTYKGLLLRFT